MMQTPEERELAAEQTIEMLLEQLIKIKTGEYDCIKTLANDHSRQLSERLTLLSFHLASAYGQLSIVEFLSEQGPELINKPDGFENFRIINAMLKNKPTFALRHWLSKLVYEGVGLLEIAPLFAHDKKYTATRWANERGHSQVAQWLMSQSKDIVKQPQFIYSSALGGLSRRPSFFQIDTGIAETSVTFKVVKKLGEGRNGLTRLFESDNGDKIAVKSLKKTYFDISETKREELSYDLECEAHFNRKAYPDDRLSEIYEFNNEKNGSIEYTNRFVMDYVEGETAWELIPKITCVGQLAEITYRIAQELLRIHTLDVPIIHGDIQPCNVMIYSKNNKFVVRIIDFGRAYYLQDPYVCNYIPLGKVRQWMPPELCAPDTIKPNTSQDVYSFGYMLSMLFVRHPSYPKLISSFPSIREFISKAMNEEPSNRPSLETFCQQISSEINLKAVTTAQPNAENRLKRTIDTLMTESLWAKSTKIEKTSTPVSSLFCHNNI